MSRTIRNNSKNNTDGTKVQPGRRKRDREIALRVVRRGEPDLRRMGRALIALAIREAEAEAQAAQQTTNPQTKNDLTPPSGEESAHDR